MFSLFHLQIIIEVAFFVAILLLLAQIKRNIDRYRPLADGSAVADIKKMLAESRELSEGFLASIAQNKQALGQLAAELDEKHKKLTLLIAEADRAIDNLGSPRFPAETAGSAMSYDEVIDLLQKGVSRQEAAKVSGLSEDEINLVAELVRTRAGQA